MNDPVPKALLVCPVCGHENPPDGDWRVRRQGARERLDCPVCGETITVRGVPALAC